MIDRIFNPEGAINSAVMEAWISPEKKTTLEIWLRSIWFKIERNVLSPRSSKNWPKNIFKMYRQEPMTRNRSRFDY